MTDFKKIEEEALLEVLHAAESYEEAACIIQKRLCKLLESIWYQIFI